MSTIFNSLETERYLPSDETFRELLRLGKNATAVADKVHESYFKILASKYIQAAMVASAIPKLTLLEAQLTILRNEHQALYKIVKEECIVEGMTAVDRNKATNFARSAYSTLATHLKLDGKIVDATAITKSECTRYIKQQKEKRKAVYEMPIRQACERVDQLLNQVLKEGKTNPALKPYVLDQLTQTHAALGADKDI